MFWVCFLRRTIVLSLCCIIVNVIFIGRQQTTASGHKPPNVS
jgi:hypothetical protein